MQQLSAAQQVRNELKERFGITSRDVSVRQESSTLRVMIKNPIARLSEIREIAKKHEKKHYCQYSGEILSGGNFYIDVSIGEGAIKALTSIHAEKLNLEKLFKDAQALEQNQFISIDGIDGALLGKHSIAPNTISLFLNTENCTVPMTYVYSVRDIISALYRRGAI